MRTISLLFFLSLVHRPALAGAGFASAAFNQIGYRMFCGQVSYTDITKAGYDCRHGQSIGEDAFDILDQMLFQEAASIQAKKDLCLADILKAIRQTESVRKELAQSLLMQWVGLKKSQLIRKACEDEFYLAIDPVLAKREGLQKAWAHTLKSKTHKPDPDWAATCLNDDTRKALYAAEFLYQVAIPNFSAGEFFELFEKNRHAAWDLRSKAPVSDATLLKEDLSKLPWLRDELPDDFMKHIDEVLKNYEEQRRDSAKDLASGSISSAQRDYIFDEKTLNGVLVKRGFAKRNNKGGVDPISPGAACTLAWQEHNAAGEIAEFFSTSIFAAGLIYKAVKGTKVALSFSKSMLGGSLLTSFKDGAMKVYSACMDRTRAKSRTTNMGIGQDKVQAAGQKLPKATDFQMMTLDLPEVASCKEIKAEQTMINKGLDPSCLREAIDGVVGMLPLSANLPLMVF